MITADDIANVIEHLYMLLNKYGHEELLTEIDWRTKYKTLSVQDADLLVRFTNKALLNKLHGTAGILKYNDEFNLLGINITINQTECIFSITSRYFFKYNINTGRFGIYKGSW